MSKKQYYYLMDEDGGEHEFYGTLEEAIAEAEERGFWLDDTKETPNA